jgi:amidase
MNAKDVLSLDARSLSNAIKTKQVTCEELMEATLERIHAINSKCNAIIQLRDEDDLMSLAREADRDYRKGWLHGIPVAIKDLSNVKGIPTTMGGSALFETFVPNSNDFFVDNIVKEGAIVIGKTNAPENGLGSHTFNSRWGTTVNPFDMTKSAGGSSGGAAVAVATRMLCLADGSDMMGSLRNPAGWNNLFSHRPTAGLIAGTLPSKKNPLPYPISTPGPIARTPVDCALLLETMAGKDKFQALELFKEEESIKGLKIGWLGDWGGSIPFEDGILPLCRNGLDSLEKEGHEVTDLSQEPLFPLLKLWNSWNRIRFAMVSFNYAQAFDVNMLLGDNSPIKEDLQWEIRQGMDVSDEDLKEAGEVQQEYAAWLESTFGKYDVLALPSAQVWPFPANWKWPKSIGDVEMDTYHRWMEVCVPVSFGGLPCTTVPAGFHENGLPMGIQLFAKRGDDLKLLLLAHAYHQSNDWPSRSEWSESDERLLKVDAKHDSTS